MLSVVDIPGRHKSEVVRPQEATDQCVAHAERSSSSLLSMTISGNSDTQRVHMLQTIKE